MATKHETFPFLDGLLRRPIVALVLLIAVELLFSGVAAQDHNLLSYFGAVLAGSPLDVPPDRQFLLESVLPDEIGAGLTRLGLHGFPLFWVWWTIGIALLAGAFWFAVRAGRLSIQAVIVLFAISHLTDTLSLYVFKSDPYLLAFVILALAVPSAWLATVFMVLAGLCHPAASAFACAGIGLARYMMDGRWEQRWFVGAALAAFIGEAAVHFIVGPITGRLENNVAGVVHTAARGLLTAAPAMLGTVVLPALTFTAIGAALGKPMPSRRGAIPFLILTAVVAFVSMILTQDHTRIFTLAMLGAMAVIAQHLLKGYTPERPVAATDAVIIGVLFLARLVAPQMGGGGARLIDFTGFFH
jgi:hypothetical protein